MANTAPTAASSGQERKWLVTAICAGLIALTFAVFGRALSNGFVDFDDNAYVYQNPVVSRGLTLHGVKWAFSGAHANNWHPLTWLSHMVDCQLYKLNPPGHHLTNILLHAATATLLFLVLRRLTGATWRCAFIAAVFAVHPLRVESVAWVAERKDVLSGLFFVLTLWAYTRFARENKFVLYVLSVLFFALGLMSKPMVVSLPAVLLVLDYWPLRRAEKWTNLVVEKIPFFCLSAASCLVTIWAQGAAIQSVENYPLSLRLANAVVTIAVYLRQMVYPAGLAVIYHYPRAGLPPLEVAAAAVLLIGVSWVAWTHRRSRPWLLCGWLWYLIMLLPALGIVQAGNQPHADRYTYLPQIGIYLSITWLAAEWIANRAVAESLAAGTVAMLAIAAWHQAGFWKDSETLWTHALRCTKDNEMAHYGMGNVYLARKDYANATREYQIAAQLKPTYAEAHNNLGLVQFNQGNTDAAMENFERALQINSNYADALFNLGNAYLRKEQWENAIEWFNKSLASEPDRGVVHGNLGIALYRLGKKNEAIREFQMSAALSPDDAKPYFNLGEAFRELGKPDEAVNGYERALKIDPTYLPAHLELASVYRRMGKLAKAADQFKQALEIEPKNSLALNGLAWLCATSTDSSLRDAKQAVQLAEQSNAQAGGKNPIYLRTLAAAYAADGRFDDARKATDEAIKIVRAARREDMAKDLEEDLKLYARGQPLKE